MVQTRNSPSSSRAGLNSGSPTFPHHLSARLGTIGILEITPGRVRAEIVALGPSPGHANPARAQHVVIEDGVVTEASLAGHPMSREEFALTPGERIRHLREAGRPH